MNPFLEIPIGIVNTDKVQKDTVASIKPGEIEYYYPGFHEGTVIVMRSGNAIFCHLTKEQLTAGIDQYYGYVKANPGKFGTLTLNTKKKEESPLIVQS